MHSLSDFGLMPINPTHSKRQNAASPIESGQTYALKLTAAGAKAIAVDETTASESMGPRLP